MFLSIARIFRKPDDAISLRDVWFINDSELNEAAEVVIKRLRDEEELARLHLEVAWLAQALIEFMDLMSFNPSPKGRFQYINYLYFESVHALREATVGMLNDSPRASTGLLRSIFEMLLLHCWWQKRIERMGNTKQFYDWLEGRRQKPKFRDMVENNFDWLGIPATLTVKKNIQRTYGQLCSYVHAPIRKESCIILNRGNVDQAGIEVLRNWLVLARGALRIGLEHLVHLYPQSLFPVDITRKFGFNSPVGMYYDQYNFVPLEAVFGEEQIKTYQSRLQDHPTVEGVINYFDSLPDLTDEQILESWDKSHRIEDLGYDTDDPVVLLFNKKAQMRVASMLLTYSDPIGPNW